MDKFYGNYLGLCISNTDPEFRGRVQIFIPHIMPAMYERWNQAGLDRKIEIIGNNLEQALPQEDIEQLKKMLPWAEAASPVFGNSVAGHYNPQSGNFNQTYGTEAQAIQAATTPNSIASLGTDRQQLFGAALNDPEILNRLAFLAEREVGTNVNQQTAFLETVFNRYQFGSQAGEYNSFKQVLFNSYWGSGSGSKPITSTTQQAIANVLGGSNITNLATDNASNAPGNPVADNRIAAGVTGGWFSGGSPTGRNQGEFFYRANGGGGYSSGAGKKADEYAKKISVNLTDPSSGSYPGSSNPAQPSPFLSPEPGPYTSISPDQQALLNNVASTVGSGTLPGSGLAVPGAGAAGGSGGTGSVTINRVPPSGTGQGQLTTGQITLNLPSGGSRTYNFNNGGWAKGAIPAGQYNISGGVRTQQSGMVVDGSGWKFNLSDKYDSGAGATRTALRIHPDGGSTGTAGCLGIIGSGATQEQFYADMKAILAANGGNVSTNIVDNLPGTGLPGGTSGGQPSLSQPATMVGNPTSTQATVTDTTGMPQGLFSVPNPGAMLWVFFREGDPLFPVYFAASYGSREWQNAYKSSSPGAHYPQEGDTTPRNQAIFRPNQSGGISFVDTMTEEEDNRSLRIFHANGGHMEWHQNGSLLYSPNEHVQQVAGNAYNSCLNREDWTQGDSRHVAVGDKVTIVGNISQEALAIIEEHAQIVKGINKNMLKGG